MAKITTATLKSAMATYINSAYTGAAWNASLGGAAFTGLLNKIGKIVTLDGVYSNKLSNLNGDDLPLGKTIEEYFIDLTLPTTYTSASVDGDLENTPALPAVESVVYSYSLGRQYIKTTLPYDDFERAMNTAEDAANCGAKIIERLQNSYDVTRYFVAKQLLGNAAEKAYAVTGCKKQIDAVVDTASGEKFVQAVREAIEDAQFAQENGLAGAFIGAAPSMTLYVKKGVQPVLDVQVLSSIFNPEKMNFNVKVEVIEDFGTTTNSAKFVALLVDDRAIKVHNGYNATRSKENANGDFINFVKHYELTCFISKYAYIKLFHTAS